MAGIAVAALGVAALSGCGGTDPLKAILATAPAGTTGTGMPWTMTAVSARLTDSNTRLSVTMFGEPGIAACQTGGATQDYVFWSMPAAMGRRDLQLDIFDLFSPDNQTVTVYTQSTDGGTGVNNILTDGIMNITQLDGVDGGTVATGATNQVTLGMKVQTSSSGIDINGTFTTDLCP